MKVALTVWEDTVSTVCDFSSTLLVFDVIGHEVKNKSFIPFRNEHFRTKVNQLEALGVEVLLCGAISRQLERMISSSGVKVVSWLRGSIKEVIEAYLVDGLADARFILPGHCPGAGSPRGRGRHRRIACGFPTAVKVEKMGLKGNPDHFNDSKQGGKDKRKMKVAITAGGENLSNMVDRSFGRAKFFIITDPDGGDVEVLENSQNVKAAQGAGIQAAQHIANKSVDVLLTGNVGPNAFRALEAASIQVFQFGRDILTIRDALTAWKEGRLQKLQSPTAKGDGF